MKNCPNNNFCFYLINGEVNHEWKFSQRDTPYIGIAIVKMWCIFKNLQDFNQLLFKARA